MYQKICVDLKIDVRNIGTVPVPAYLYSTLHATLFVVDAGPGEPAAPRHQGEEAHREGDPRHLLQRYTSKLFLTLPPTCCLID